jgi:branched-chain amino acid transport system substrate-binding protein
MKRFAIGLTVLIAIGLLGASPLLAANKIRIGYLLPLSGGGAEYGQRQLRGATLALEEINAQQAQTGFSIEMITSDTRCVPLEASNAAERLIERARVQIMVGGSCSPEAIAALRVTRRVEMPHIVPTAAAVSITEEGNPFVFRTIPHNHHLAEQLADTIVDRLKLKRVATVYLNDDFGIDLNTALVKRLTAKGVQIVAQEGVERTTMDFFAVVAKLKPLNPEAVIAPVFNKPAAQLARTMREQGMAAPLMDTVMFTAEFHELAGPAAHGTVQNLFFHHTTKNPQGRAFAERFKAKYNDNPGNFEAEAYDAIWVLADALKRGGAGKAGYDKNAFLRAMRETRAFPGVMGPITFDGKGQVLPAEGKITVIHNKDGKVEVMQ